MARRNRGTSNITEISDESLQSGEFQHKEEVYRVKYVKGARNSAYPFHQMKTREYEYKFIKTYLFALYEGVYKDKKINVNSFRTHASFVNPIIIAPNIKERDEKDCAILENDLVTVDVSYEGSVYQLSIYMKVDSVASYDAACYYFIAALGVEPESVKPAEVIDHVIRESIKNSYFRNKILSLKTNPDNENYIDIDILSRKGFSEENLEKIFIPENIKSELYRFEQAVKNYDKIGLGLRYLLCGEPGTAKTKSIRALINQCYGYATIILVQGNQRLSFALKLAKLLTPTIICYDDLDLLIGSRDEHFSPKELGSFLNELDGFEKYNLFILATTNSKELIDSAASRPGRFDLLLDFNKIDSENYKMLIEANTENEVIRNTFDEEILFRLTKLKVTGAYVVNLVKQLGIVNKLNPENDLKRYLKNLIKLSYKGFYKAKEENEFGFAVNGN